MNLLDVILQGLLLGGLYTMFAIGLSLLFGVMRLVNIAHGDFIVLAAYMAHAVLMATGWHPFATLLVVVPVMAGVGYVLQRAVLARALGDDILPPLLVTFGFAVIIQNGLLSAFTSNALHLPSGDLQTASLPHGAINIGLLPLITLLAAVALIWGLETLFARTAIGRAFRATSDDAEIATALGVKTAKIFALATALCFATIAIAGVFLAMRSNFDPFAGPARLLFGFEAVIIGGIGSFWGTLAGGLILGVTQSLGAQISPQFQILAGHIVFFLILAFRPRGLFPKTA
ncbi:MAG: branched-chain amino acid ABC transporter permease [Mesorhizobium sp.]|uniref:branched-chain amino acid ABC transporter permease n=1 Tax=Mesorhizobium sp. TaxID=1871066 RepID=UPI000FE78DEA|nr:branched-chain amino acid ABC transporter permease [Mesorhizobium sp.]RWI57299.1 MAG: branched-chain amino acid ABC transporter permease [Mesorhizobium sp.]